MTTDNTTKTNKLIKWVNNFNSNPKVKVFKNYAVQYLNLLARLLFTVCVFQLALTGQVVIAAFIITGYTMLLEMDIQNLKNKINP